MNLANRLYSEKMAFRHSRRFAFEFQGLVCFSFVDLIELVMERFARRFGAINREAAYRMHKRLATKYCTSPDITVAALGRKNTSSLEFKCPCIYPKEEVRRFINLCLDIESQNTNAERECIAEKRRFVPKELWGKEKQKEESRRYRQAYTRICNDNSNLKECRKLINQIKEVFNENT